MTQFNGSKLRELRNEKQLSIAKLSTISDVSTGLISQIERDLVVPSALILFRLAQALETDMYAFFEDTPPEDTPIIRKRQPQPPDSTGKWLYPQDTLPRPSGSYAGFCGTNTEKRLFL